MSDLPAISVIVPTYDEPQRLQQALGSLSRQDYPADKVEIVVVDDASPALAEDAVHAAAAGVSLKLIHNDTNQGRARSRNRGIESAEGELLIFLDSDMTVNPDFFSAHARAHACHRGAVVIGNIRFAEQIPRTSLTRYIDRRGVHRLAPGEPVPFKCFVTGNSSIHRSQLLDVGLFDEDFRQYGGEDLELGYRLHRSGVRFQYAPEALSLHNHLRPLEQTCDLMKIYGMHSLPLLIEKHPELADLLHLGFARLTHRSPRRIFFALLLSQTFYWPIHLYARLAMDYFVPERVFEYVWWYHRTRGYLEFSKHTPVRRRNDNSACV